MRKTTRSFVLSLEGPPCSYCTCNRLCSRMEMDHVLPKVYLKSKIIRSDILSVALNDPHNLYRVCNRKNSEKAATLLSDSVAGDEFSGMKARSYLYMNWRYGLNMDQYLLSSVKSMSLMHRPFNFEIRRSKEIAHYTSQGNPFIEYFPLSVAEKY
jgi:endonuclease I